MIGKSRLFGRGNRDFLIGEIATSPSGQPIFARTADHRPDRDVAIDIAIGPMKFFSPGDNASSKTTGDIDKANLSFQ